MADGPLSPVERRRLAAKEQARRQEAARANARSGRGEQAARIAFVAAAEKAAARHPEIDQQVFRDIIAAYDAESENFKRREAEIRADAPNKGYLNAEIMKLRAETGENIRKRVSNHGEEGAAAMRAINSEKAPESMWTPLVRMFYNTDKGGLQLGGLGGAAVAGGAAYFMASSAGAGTWLTLGITALATAIGAYAGNRAFPAKSTLQVPNFRTPAKGTGPSKSPEKAPDGLETKRTTMPDVKVNNTDIKPADLTGGEDVAFRPERSAAPTPDKPRQI